MPEKKNSKRIAKPRSAIKEVFPPELHDSHPLSSDWSGTIMAFELLEKFIDDRHKVLRCYDGFDKAYPQLLKESGRVREIKEKVLKLLWDNAGNKSKRNARQNPA